MAIDTGETFARFHKSTKATKAVETLAVAVWTGTSDSKTSANDYADDIS